MALRNYQESLELGKLYKIERRGAVSGTEQIAPSLYFNSGIVDVYHSNGATAPTAKSEMVLNSNDSSLTGINRFYLIPTYIFIEQISGTTTEIVASGLGIEDLGAI